MSKRNEYDTMVLTFARKIVDRFERDDVDVNKLSLMDCLYRLCSLLEKSQPVVVNGPYSIDEGEKTHDSTSA